MTDNRNLEVIRSPQHYVLMDIISNSYTWKPLDFCGPPTDIGKYLWGTYEPANPDYQSGIIRHVWRRIYCFFVQCGKMINALNISHHIWCTCFNHYRNRNRNRNHNHIRTISRLFLFLFYYFIEFILMKLFIFLLLIFNT